MEANISSSVKECLGLQNDVGDAAVAVKLTKSQKKNMRKRMKKKLKANLEPVDKPKDSKSLLNNSLAATGDSKSLISGTENDKGNGATKLSKSQKQRMSKKLKKMQNDGATTDPRVISTEDKENKSNLSQSLNLQCLENLKPATGGVDSGTIATGTTGLKKRKRKKNGDKNSDMREVMKTCENTVDNLDANKGLGKTKVVEAINAEMASGKSENPVEILSGTTNVNGHGTKKKKEKRKLNKDKRNLGEIMNPQDLQDLVCENSVTGSVSTATDTVVSKKRKRKKMKDKDVISGGILSTSVGPQDTVSTNNGSSGTLTVGLDTNKKTEVKDVATLGKKLLIIDVNGLLADIVYGPPKDIKADKYILRRAIFKRPFLDDFLRFCFERFNVAIWSSRTKKNLDPVVDFLLGDLKKKLLFCWDSSQCTNTGVRTLEDKHKFIVFKDLSKIWDKNGPANSWVKGSFHESNTLLLDDSPYKALLNNKHIGIFPASYSYKDKDDDFLGPKGKLRTFLEGLATADDVKTYVEQHPLGQGAIDENSQNWAFYSRVLKRQSR